MIISISSTKGGVGKSTIAINLATQLNKLGKEVVLLDADPQGSSIKWAKTRQVLNPDLPDIFVASAQGKALIEIAVTKSNSGSVVLVDSAGVNDENTRNALLKSDYVITASAPSPLDLWEISQMIGVTRDLGSIQNRVIPVLLVFNKVHPNTKDLSDVHDFMSSSQIYPQHTFKTLLRERMIYQSSIREGKAVCEYKKDDKSAIEFEKFTKELLNHINPN